MSLILQNRPIGGNHELISLYRENLDKLGFCSETLFYHSQLPHQKKMAHVGTVISSETLKAGHQLLDVGCGFGDLINYLPVNLEYLGVDLLPEFVSEAKRRFPDHNFTCGDIAGLEIGDFDTVVLAGVLSSVPSPRQVLTNAIGFAKSRVVFDVTLRDRVRRGFEGLNLWTTDQALMMAKRSGLSRVDVHDEGNAWIVLSGVPLRHGDSVRSKQ